jgi:hypothetical protein
MFARILKFRWLLAAVFDVAGYIRSKFTKK